MGSWTDSQLMTQFLAGQEGSEPAFRMLIHRHGPMVLGVCRRILGDEHAAEDAFQATFLVLLQKARTLRDCDLLTNWLYGVALKVAAGKSTKALGDVVERQVAESSMTSEVESDQSELRSVIDEEIQRLPERYRLPLVLCHVEGLRHDEVARGLAARSGRWRADCRGLGSGCGPGWNGAGWRRRPRRWGPYCSRRNPDSCSHHWSSPPSRPRWDEWPTRSGS